MSMGLGKAVLNRTVINDLQRLFPGAVETDVPLDQISRWRIGGLADVIVSPRSIEELASLRAWIHTMGLPSVVIGATSNLLFADEGLRAIAIRMNSTFTPLSINGQNITIGSGVWVPRLARTAMMASLTGLEHTCGIPGTLGGLVCMNGGSQRKGIGDLVTSVQSIDARGNVKIRTNEQCEFSYRRSIFQQNDEIITSVSIRLDTAPEKRTIRRDMLDILRSRRSKFPQKLPNCGSTFVSNPAMYATHGTPGKVIEEAGFKGFRIGNAFVSDMHANFIINDTSRTGSNAHDVLRLIHTIRDAVAGRTGYYMDVEVRYVQPNGKIISILSQ
jgi:UDP-N-acetylmuramate dehydrogenase